MSYVGLLKESYRVDCSSREKKKPKSRSSGGFPREESRTDSRPEHGSVLGAWLLLLINPGAWAVVSPAGKAPLLLQV